MKPTADDAAEEVADLLAERQLLREALARELRGRPWPRVGDTVVIGAPWDGLALHGDDFLSLEPDDVVRVLHVTGTGWLWGAVENTNHAGWFGGGGCVARAQVSVSMPLGPSDPTSSPPTGPPGSDAEPRPAPLEPDLQPEVQEYVDRYGVDEAAQQALRMLPVEEQRKVIDADLVKARNPSAVLLSRIRAARKASLEGALAAAARGTERGRSRSSHRSTASDYNLPEEVEVYITRHNIDETAGQILRKLSASIQQEVIQNDLNNCRNPSAVLMSRIRTLQLQENGRFPPPLHAGHSQPAAAPGLPAGQPGLPRSALEAGAAAVPLPSPSASAHAIAAVEEYIQRYGLDERTANEMRTGAARAMAAPALPPAPLPGLAGHGLAGPPLLGVGLAGCPPPVPGLPSLPPGVPAEQSAQWVAAVAEYMRLANATNEFRLLAAAPTAAPAFTAVPPPAELQGPHGQASVSDMLTSWLQEATRPAAPAPPLPPPLPPAPLPPTLPPPAPLLRPLLPGALPFGV